MKNIYDMEMNMPKNATLELFKLLASYMVVFIHVKFYGHIGTVIETLARFAVPLFFLVSGFYSYQITPEKIRVRIRNIISLLVFSAICYTLFQIIPMLLSRNLKEIGEYFGQYFNIITLCKLLLLNKPVHTLHLWYLLAIVYVYILFYLVTKYKVSEKVIFT